MPAPLSTEAARALHMQGRLAEAEPSYRAILAAAPQDAEASHLLGVLLLQRGLPEDALPLLQAAVALRPAHAASACNLGNALRALGRFAAALAAYEAALAAQPGFALAQFNRGVTLGELGRLEEAVAAYQAALALEPGDTEAWLNLGNTLRVLGRGAEALAALDRALALAPGQVPALLGRAGVLREMGRNAAALATLDQVLAAQPRLAMAHLRRGELLLAQGQPEPGMAALRRALALDPEHAEAHVALGEALLDAGRHEPAIASLSQALRLAPETARALNLRGIALAAVNRAAEAAADFTAALALAPEDADLWGNLGEACSALGRFEEARQHARRAAECLAGGNADAAVVAVCADLAALNHLPALYESEAQLQAERARLEAGLDDLAQRLAALPAATPAARALFRAQAFRTPGFYIAYQQQEDRAVMQRLSGCLAAMLGVQPGPLPRRRHGGPIRLGIASANLHDHNGARWALDWLRQLPPGYAFFTYKLGGPRDAVAAQFAALGTHRELPFTAATCDATLSAMRADALDLLMLPDVGMTPASRVLSLHRVAPVQFTAWGHPVTTGSPAMDYYLSSDLMEPEDGAAHYSEQLVRLPNLALYLRPPAPRPPVATPALPEGRLLIGCLQSLYKYLPQDDALLVRVAQALPQSVLVFIEGHPAYMTALLRARLERAFAAAGMAASRHVLFLPRMGGAQFSAVTARMAFCLDSIGWSGGNTTLEAIEAGVPVLTLPGRFMRGRHSLAMLRMLGLDELVATSAEDFLAIASRLGREPDWREDLRRRLRERRGVLYEDRSFITALDRFLRQAAA